MARKGIGKGKKKSKIALPVSVTRAANRAAAEAAVEKQWNAQFDNLRHDFSVLSRNLLPLQKDFAKKYEALKRSHDSVMARLGEVLPNQRADNSGALTSLAGRVKDKGLGRHRLPGSFESAKK